MSRSVKQLFHCHECPNLTPNHPNMSGLVLCQACRTKELLFCQEIHSEFRQD